jgi:ATP-dependent Clp protease protease subunit
MNNNNLERYLNEQQLNRTYGTAGYKIFNQFVSNLPETAATSDLITSYAPMVIEEINGVERHYDIYSRLLKDGIIYLRGQVDGLSANSIVAQLLWLDSEKKGEEIGLWINSPGGVVTDGLAIYDTMKTIDSPVATLAVGQAASMGSFLLAGGDEGLRSATSNTRIMIHQPLGGAQGQATDIMIHAQEIQRLKDLLTSELAANCKQDTKELMAKMERDNFLSAQEALDLGIIDQIVPTKKKKL